MECQPPRETEGIKTRVPLKLEEYAAGITIGLLGLITFANVVVRYLTDFSFAFTEEISIFLMVLVALLGGSSVMAKGGHLSILFVVDRLPPGRRRLAFCAAQALSVLMFALLAYYGARMAWDEYRFEVTSPGLGVPTWYYTVWLPVLSLAICGRAAGAAIRTWRRKP
ncbi:MAG TPA: TRAP transporter small permease [Syntrophales bacterium]|jgi:TRAP-type C4-dicarboxylate transport system permease small subunit|nr:TRAP transporter small permease [Syntrophales bacterium]